jgi:glycogen(starch) synthase
VACFSAIADLRTRPRPGAARLTVRIARLVTVTPRVLILSWEYPPIVAGGLARHVRKLSEALVAQGVAVHVLTRGGRDHVEQEVRAGVHIHRVAEKEMPHDLDAFVSWVEGMNSHMHAAGRRLGKRLQFDVVHGHDWLVAGAAAAIAERLRCPYLTTIHATEYGRHQGWVDKHPQSYIHGIETWMAGRADHVITCSHYMRGHVADVYDIDERRVTVIPNGIDPADLQPVGDLDELRARFAAPDERLVLLVGRLVYEKGFQLALDAMPQVIRRAGRVRFLVAGSGTHEGELRKQARRLGLMRHGTFMGWIGDDMLHSLYRIADLCVVPSIYEPFGLVALEAMASGCPCIVADTGGLREVVPNADVGLRFRSRNPRALATMMQRVLTDDALRDRLVAEASAHVLRFDWADVAERTAQVYGELGGASRAGADVARRPA